MRYIIIRFIKVSLTVLILSAVALQVHANNGKEIDLWDPVFYFEEDGSRYVRFTSALQIWLRHTDLNPGSGISGTPASNATDLSIRRLRLGLSAVPFEKAFFRLNLGFNNLNQASKGNVKVEFLDVYAEYRPSRAFEFGAGKSAWTGLSRYSAPAASRMLTYDLPIVALPNLNVTDNLLRNLGIYFKGQVKQLDYRLSIFKPYSVEQSPGFDPVPEENIAKYRDETSGNTEAISGYLKWQFFEHESNNTAFSPGTYLGEKKVMAVGVGYELDKNRTIHLENGEPVINDLKLWAVDFFLDLPLDRNEKNALTVYTAYYNYDYGPNLVRNIGVNNIATIFDPDAASFNGAGNAYPLLGTGNTIYLQAGYLTRKLQIGRLQPYFSIQYSKFQRLDDPMLAWNVGTNWLLRGHQSKFSFNIENRPVFFEQGNSIESKERKLMIVLQYQLQF